MTRPSRRTLDYWRQWTVEGVCLYCGSGFSKPQRGRPYKFCSRFCAVRGRSGESKRNKTTLRCRTCGISYEVKPRRAGLSFYCSVKCMMASSDMEFIVGNQRRGYDAELRCIETLAGHGFIVCRSAASRGPFDVIAIGDGGVYLIQVKRVKDPARRKQPEVVRELQKLLLPATVHKQIWCWVDRKGWFITDIMRDGCIKSRWMEEADYTAVAGIGGGIRPMDGAGLSGTMQ